MTETPRVVDARTKWQRTEEGLRDTGSSLLILVAGLRLIERDLLTAIALALVAIAVRLPRRAAIVNITFVKHEP